MYKLKVIKIDIYVVLGFLLSFVFFDVDGIEFIFNIKIEYIIVVCCILAWGLMIKDIKINSLICAYMLYFGILALSTFFNNNEVFSLLYYASRIITCITLVEYLIKKKYFNSFFRGVKYFMALAILLTIYFQIYSQDIFGYTPSGNYNNFFSSDNYLGYIYIIFLLIVYFTNLGKGKIQQKVEIVSWSCLCICSLVRAWSAGALLGLIIFILVFILIHKSDFLKSKITFANVILVNAIIFYLVVIARVHVYFEWLIKGILHKSMTLSLRTYIWDSAIKNIREKLILGYGTCKGQVMNINSFVLNGKVGTYFSHNYFLENLIQGGIMAGIALLLIYYVVIIKCKDRTCKSNVLYAVIALSNFCVLFMGQSGIVLFQPTIHIPIIFMYYCKEIVHVYQ